MSRQTAEDDDWDESNDEFDDEDLDDDLENEVPISPCPFCRRDIHSEIDQCPFCKNYMSDEEGTSDRKPWFVWVGVALCVLMFVLGLTGNLALPGQLDFSGDASTILIVTALILAVVIAFCLLNFCFGRVFGISLLCHCGLHRWKKEFSGMGRDRRHIYRCRRCEGIKER